MAAVASGNFLYIPKEDRPDWLKEGARIRIVPVKDSKNYVLWLTNSTQKRKGVYGFNSGRLAWIDYHFGMYSITEHTKSSIMLIFLTADVILSGNEKEENQDNQDNQDSEQAPDIDPETITESELRDWIIRNGIKLVQKGKAPLWWNSIVQTIKENVKERDAAKAKEKPKEKDKYKEPQRIKSDVEILQTIIDSPNSRPQDIIAAMNKLKEIVPPMKPKQSATSPLAERVEVAYKPKETK